MNAQSKAHDLASHGVVRIDGDKVEGWAHHPFKTEIVDVYADGARVAEVTAAEFSDHPAVPVAAQRAVFKLSIIDLAQQAAQAAYKARYLAEHPQAEEIPPSEEPLASAPFHANGFELRVRSTGASIAKIAADGVIRGKIRQLTPTGVVMGEVTLSSRRYAAPASMLLVINGERRAPFQLDVPHNPPRGFYTASFSYRLPLDVFEAPKLDLSLIVDDGLGGQLIAHEVLKAKRPMVTAAVRAPVGKLLIADPSLASLKGHMLGCAERLTLAARAMDMQVELLAHERFPFEDLHGAPIHRIFPVSPYDQASARGLGDVIGDLENFAPGFIRAMDAFAQEHDLSNTVIFYPTVNHVLAPALARWLQERAFEPGEHHLPYFMLESGLVLGPDGLISTDRMFSGLYQKGLFAYSQAPAQHVSVCAASKRLRDDLQALSAAPVHQAPSLVGYERAGARPPVNGRLEFSLYFGEVKRDKGFHLLPDLLEALRPEREKFRFHYQIHDTRTRDSTDEIAQRIAQITSEPGWEVAEHRGYMSGAAYERTMRGLHGMAVAYDPARYAAKTSGLVWEAISLRLPIVIPSESWAQSECAHARLPYAAFKDQDAGQIAEAIKKLGAELLSKNDAGAPAGDPALRFGGAALRDFICARYVDAQSGECLRDVGQAYFTQQAAQTRRAVRREVILKGDAPELLDGWGPNFKDEHAVVFRPLAGEGVVALYVDRGAPLKLSIRLRFADRPGEGQGPAPRLMLMANGEDVPVELKHYNDMWVELHALLPQTDNDAPFSPTLISLKAEMEHDAQCKVLFEGLRATSSHKSVAGREAAK